MPAGHARNGRISLPVGQVLSVGEPKDYAGFLRQRVETNYLAAALVVSEHTAVQLLRAAMSKRELSFEDLRDAFAVSYETAAHRFTNLATEHLGIPVNSLKVQASGTISKAYENDSAAFPTDALGAERGNRLSLLDGAAFVRRRRAQTRRAAVERPPSLRVAGRTSRCRAPAYVAH